MEANATTQWLLPMALALIMFGIGLSLSGPDFKRIKQQPGVVLIGLCGQLLLMPAVALAIAFAMSLPASMAIGLLLLAACPGGTMSNVMSQLLKADLALSVTLTALSTIACVVTTPLLVQLAVTLFSNDTAPSFSMLSVSGGVLITTLIPVLLGMGVRHWQGPLAIRIEPWFQRFSLVFLCLLIVALISKEWELLRSSAPALLAACGILSIATSILGWGLGWAGHMTTSAKRTLCIEVGIQNAALAIVIALSFMQSSAYSVMPGLYGIIMYIAPAAIIALHSKVCKNSAADTNQENTLSP